MKTIAKIAMLAAAALSLTVFASCNKETSEEAADTTELNATIAEADAILENATTALFPQEAINAFKTTLTAVKTAAAAPGITQKTVDNLLAQLKAAISTLKAAAFDSIPAEALTFECKFDGEADKTTGVNAWNLVPACGPAEVFGTEKVYPTYVEGKVGKAVKLEKGANFNITGFNPASLAGNAVSIAVWVKPSRVYANNYIVSFNRWSSWKLQLQDGSKPFMTVSTGTKCVDADNETDNSCPAGEWHHVVVTANITTGDLDFYVDGQLTRHWGEEKVSGTGIPVAEENNYLCIGQQCSWETACLDSWFTPSDQTEDTWSCFWGCLDELKVYNKALTAGQVALIYATEK